MTRERITTGTYRAVDFGLNWSLLKRWRDSPMAGHYAETTGDVGADSAALAIGRAFHVAALEPDTFGDRFVALTGEQVAALAPARNTKEGKAAFARYVEAHPAAMAMTSDEWQRACVQAAYPGRALLSLADRDLVLAMAAAVRAHGAARALLDRAVECETVRRWTHARTETKCKGRLDAVLDSGDIIDLKSTRSLVPNRFLSDAWENGAIHQGAFYRQGQRATGTKRPAFTLIAVGKKYPIDVCVRPVSGFLLDECDEEIDALFHLRADCNARGEWPGAYPEPVPIEERPRWAQSDIGDDEMTVTVKED